MALKHPNIVRCVECFTHANKLCIVMDFCSEGLMGHLGMSINRSE